MNALFFLAAGSLVGADAPAPMAATPIVMQSNSGCVGCGSATPVYSSQYPMSYPSAYTGHIDCGASTACSPKVRLFERLRNRVRGVFNRSGTTGCMPTTTCYTPPISSCAPAVTSCSAGCGTPSISQPLYTGFAPNQCDPCNTRKLGLLDRLRSRMGSLTAKNCSSPCQSTMAPCDSCGSVSGSYSSPVIVQTMPTTMTPAPTPATPTSPATPAIPEKMPEVPEKTEPKKEPTSVGVPVIPLLQPTLGGTNGGY